MATEIEYWGAGCGVKQACPHIRNEDLACEAAAINRCYDATYGPVDMAAPPTHGDYQFNADGTGKLERWNATTDCLEVVHGLQGNRVKYTDASGVMQVAAFNAQTGAWEIEAPSGVADPNAVLTALVAALADPANAADCGALVAALISTDANNTIRAGSDLKLFENDAV